MRRSAIVTISLGPSVGIARGLDSGDGLAFVDASLETGRGDSPLPGIGGGVPLGRTRKTGPLSRAAGVVVGSGTGDDVALPVGRGVGGTICWGPFGGTAGMGMSDGLALGLGAALAFGSTLVGLPLAAGLGLATSSGVVLAPVPLEGPPGVPVSVGVGVGVSVAGAAAAASRTLSVASNAASSRLIVAKCGKTIGVLEGGTFETRQSCERRSAATVGSSGVGFCGSKASAGATASKTSAQSATTAVRARRRRETISVRPGGT